MSRLQRIAAIVIVLAGSAVARAQPAPPDAAEPAPPPPVDTPVPPPPPDTTHETTPEPAKDPGLDISNSNQDRPNDADDEHGKHKGKKDKKDKKDKDRDITHKRGWLEFHGPDKILLRTRLILQPMARFGEASNVPDFTMDMIIRRARLGFDAKLQKHVGLRFEISVKNMHYEIHNMFGWWKPTKHLELQFGFIKAPGGLEREAFSFDLPFIERSVVTFLNYDHEMGAKLEGESDDEHWRWYAAITRLPPALPGGDPEDSPVIPMNVEAEDLTRPISKWNAAGRVVATPSDAFEASLRLGLRFRPDEADFGEIAVEPYDTTYLTNRPWHGVWVSVSGDAALVQPHWKAVAEGGFRRDGQQLEYPDGTIASEREINGDHLFATVGYVVLGWTPNGHYGAAVDAAPLLDGWELVARFNGARVNPVDTGVATMVSGELAAHWEVSKHIRLQADVAVEKFGRNDVTFLNENRDGTRIWAQTWATLRL
jgi:hypothetical protein